MNTRTVPSRENAGYLAPIELIDNNVSTENIDEGKRDARDGDEAHL